MDHGHAHEGYAVVGGEENVLAVTLHLPDKRTIIVRKLDARRALRHAYRARRPRRRPKRFSNRRRKPDWVAPSQLVLVLARLKMLNTLQSIYPLTVAGVEDVRFDHRTRWGKTFSTVEIGKARLHRWYAAHGINASFYQGWETKAFRLEYGYKKSADKAADRFSAHCSDALVLAARVTTGARVEPGPLVIVDDRYRPVRRRLHDSKTSKGGQRIPYSRGTVRGLRKGLLIETPTGKRGHLCGTYRKAYRYYDQAGKQQVTGTVAWVSAQYLTTIAAPASSADASFPSVLTGRIP